MDGLFTATTADGHQRRFEAERVQMIVEHLRLERYLRQIYNASESLYGIRCLSLRAFREVFPTFPIVLEARYVGRLADRLRPADLLRSFKRTFLSDYYLEVYGRNEEESTGRPIGMVVPFDGYRGGVIIHDAALDTGSVRLTADLSPDHPPYRVTVEPFDKFLRHLAAGGWTPASRATGQFRCKEPPGSRGIDISPWMVKLVGAGPTLVVLAWLVHCLESPGGVGTRFVCRTPGGGRGLAGTHEQIAAETCLSTYQVKRAVAALRRKGLVTTKIGKEGHTLIEVWPPSQWTEPGHGE